MALVVETIVADCMADFRSRRDRETPADMVELRLDGVKDLDVAGALADRRRPAIVTCRPRWEGGGHFDGSEDDRFRILRQAADLGAEYVDLEWKAERRFYEACRGRTRVIVSSHDFDGTPADLRARVAAMRGMGGDVVKVAVAARSAGDCLALKRAFEGDEAHVAIAMGAPGQFTRLLPAWTSSLWTYGGTNAPGQVSTDDLVNRYRVRETTSATKVYAVTGSPLGHSASPAMHNAAFSALGLDAVYVPLEARDANEFFSLAELVALSGASVTIPLKQALLTSAVSVDGLPAEIGALNTLRRGPAGWEGRNYDVAGFLAPLDRRHIELKGRRVVVLGAGGAARAAVRGLASRGADVEISARRPEAAHALACELNVQAGAFDVAQGRPEWDILVNTTPAGMWPRVDETPVSAAALSGAAGKVVYDLVYNPLDTTLLRLARTAGATTIGGLEMLVGQACLQFEFWTGRQAPREVMDLAARSYVASASYVASGFSRTGSL